MIVHRFKIPINFSKNTEKIYYDNGFIALPNSYTDRGEPTRLIISCHGAGGTVTTDDSQIEKQTLTKYLLANGYAVMDVNGLPEEFAKENGVDLRNNVGNPFAIQSYIKAYNYAVDNFNLKREVFVHGGSMGGISSTNLVLSKSIPVIAQSGYCPVLDAYNQIFLHPWSDGLPKTALGILYDFEKDKDGNYVYDKEKVGVFNPMSHCVTANDKECLSYPVPVKFWHCEDDDTVSIESTKRFVKAILNGGGKAYLRTFSSGGHEPQLYGDFVKLPKGNTLYNGESLQITTANEELFLWLKEFDE